MENGIAYGDVFCPTESVSLDNYYKYRANPPHLSPATHFSRLSTTSPALRTRAFRINQQRREKRSVAGAEIR